MRMLLVLAGGLLLSLPAQGQTAAASGLPQNDPVTRVSITGLLAPVRAGEPPLPFEVLRQMERDPYLAQMRTEVRSQTGPALHLAYAFPSVEAYRAWTLTPQTRQLMEVLRERVSQFELTVSLTRGAPGVLLPAHD
ncbi:MAG TPA: hypothetical protein VGC13_01235 [Longimicrobium sp.]|jgi:hypothetical protein|uniref:hypothetical protein n=1 Tax=Longimicrobium sp. TaxID=2029185 RepID=UPI002EDAA13C